MNTQEQKDNVIFAVLHLREASQLLKNVDDNLSMTLLQLAEAICTNNALTATDIESYISESNSIAK